MSKIVCPSCGTRQSRRKNCISCGTQLCTSPEDERELLERMSEFRHSPFTLGVTVVSIISTVLNLAIIVIFIFRETHSANPFLVSFLLSLYASILTLFPETSYRYFVPRRRYMFDNLPEDFDNPHEESLRKLYFFALIPLVFALIITSCVLGDLTHWRL